MEISVNELASICDILVSKAKERGFGSVDLLIDNYWYISSDEREDFISKPNNLCVGSLYEDINYLRKILDEENIPTPVDFDRLANVLIAVGQRICDSNKIY